jgi:hypothetical protein
MSAGLPLPSLMQRVGLGEHAKKNRLVEPTGRNKGNRRVTIRQIPSRAAR